MFQQLTSDITRIDSGLVAPEIVACYLVESDGEAAIIETGNFETTERILALLEQRKIPVQNVRYVIPTHVHLDHAGGASSLMDVLPAAKLVIHPRGARHMIDPTKLIAGASVVYGEETFKALYGTIKPIPEQRIIIAEDNSELTFGSRKLLFRDTPGHASHHFCVWDETSRGWFTGDTFGIGYPLFSGAKGRLLFPSSTPVQFDPQQLIASIELLMSYQPEKMYLTHFGAIEANQLISQQLCDQIRNYVDIVQTAGDVEDITVEQIQTLLTNYTLQCLTDLGCTISHDKASKMIYMDMKLNSQGLLIWHQRQMKKLAEACQDQGSVP